MTRAAAAGVGLGLGQAPFGLWPVALIALAIGLTVIADAPDRRAAARAAWAFGTGYFGLTLHWIVEPFFVDAARHGWMAPFALIALAGGLAIFWAGAGYAAGAAETRTRRLFALATGLALAELARAYLFTGFPWASLGSVWLGTPIIQTSALVGPHGLTAITLFALAWAVAAWPVNRTAGLVAAALPLVPLLVIGLIRVWTIAPLPEAPRPILRLIQPDAAQHLKWLPEMRPRFFARQLDMTASATPRAPDLIIWPETAITDFLQRADDTLTRIAAAAQGRKVIAGIHTFENGGVYNVLMLLGEDARPEALYRKSHLVPFGEYVPLAGLMARLGIYGLAAFDEAGYAAGAGAHIIDTGAPGRVLPLICYEAVFPHFGRAISADADWMVQITNDAWFGNFAGPQQHLDQARLRAIERGLPLARVANTGISGVIDPWGRVLDPLPLNTAGFADIALPPRLPVTPYTRLGDALVLLALMLIAAGLALRGPASD